MAVGRHSNVANYGRHKFVRREALETLYFSQHALERARRRLALTRQQAERDCRNAILITLLRGPLPDSGDRTGHRLARGRRGIWVVSWAPDLGWVVHSVLPAGNLLLRRGTGRWWLVRRVRWDKPLLGRA